jgi:single-strand DNA-binding protein
MNHVVLIGRPTRDPELRYLSSGVPVCFYTLAVDKGYRNKEGEKEADFIQIKVWNKLAENTANYVRKGRLISLSGKIATGSYQEKDGRTKYTMEVIAENVQFLEKAGLGDTQSEALPPVGETQGGI